MLSLLLLFWLFVQVVNLLFMTPFSSGASWFLIFGTFMSPSTFLPSLPQPNPTQPYPTHECCIVGRLWATHCFFTPVFPCEGTEKKTLWTYWPPEILRGAPPPPSTFQPHPPVSCWLTSDWRRRWAPPAGRSLDRTEPPGRSRRKPASQ